MRASIFPTSMSRTNSPDVLPEAQRKVEVLGGFDFQMGDGPSLFGDPGIILQLSLLTWRPTSWRSAQY